MYAGHTLALGVKAFKTYGTCKNGLEEVTPAAVVKVGMSQNEIAAPLHEARIALLQQSTEVI